MFEAKWQVRATPLPVKVCGDVDNKCHTDYDVRDSLEGVIPIAGYKFWIVAEALRVVNEIPWKHG